MEKYKRAYKKLNRKIVISLLLLVSVFFLKQFIVRYQIVEEINTSYIINVSGRQRMLSQKIVKDMAFIHRGEASLKDEIYRKDLENSIKLLKKSHEELLNLNKENGFLKRKNIIIITNVSGYRA